MQDFKGSNARIRFISLLIFLGIFLLIGRFAYIQLIGKESYLEEVVKKFPKASVVQLYTPRGAIRDRSGNGLAISLPTLSVFAFPHLVKNKEEFARRFSAVSGLSEQEIIKRLQSEEKFVWVTRHIDKSHLAYVKGIIRDTGNDRAIGVYDDYKRVYPHGTLASNLLGYIDSHNRGIEGVELLFDERLKGKQVRGVFYLGKLAIGPLTEDMQTSDINLTIDLGVQTILEDIKEKIVKQWNPDRVGILVMDVQSGDILGMANYPTYDPNEFRKFPLQNRRNFVITDLFEPGSVMKPFFIGQALQKGYIKPRIWINTEGGKTEVFGRQVKDVKPSQSLTLEQVLIKSSNVGTIKVARFLSKKDVEEILSRIHMKDKFGVFTGEAKPRLPNFNYPANILYASIGQGMSSNLLSLCVSFNALATNRIVKPRIWLEEKPQVLQEGIFQPQVFNWLRENLINVVEEGTAIRARSDQFSIAGKTGTSQKFDFRTGKYSREDLVTYFVGYFPANNPKFIAGIMVDRPKGTDPYGGTVAAPHFKELVERVAFYYRLEPDKLSK